MSEIKKLAKLSLSELRKKLEKLETETLIKYNEYLSDLYHNGKDESPFSDKQYDLLKDILDSRIIKPTIGAKIREGENRVELPYWMGSANKITPEQPQEIEKFKNKNKTTSFIEMDKLDGVSCMCIVENKNITLYTRGDGVIGADISYFAPFFKIPTQKDIVCRGELIMKKSDFPKYEKEYKNPRNLVAGVIGGKTTRAPIKDIHFVVYEIINEDETQKISSQLEELEKLGFETVFSKKLKNISVENLKNELTERKKNSDYDVDGIIIQADIPYDRNTSGNPDYMFAFKMLFDDAIIETKVLSVEWNVSKTGQIKPVVIVKPVNTMGITINRATGHNAKYIVENGIGKGAIIKITRSKDVIPYILQVVKGVEPELPEMEFIWDKTETNIIATDLGDDNTLCVKLISDMFSKLGIKFVSQATVKKLLEGGLDNFIKIVSADRKKLNDIFTDKTAERIYVNISEGMKSVSIPVLVGSSNILGFGVGSKRVELLLKYIPDIFDPKHKVKKSDIKKIEGFADIMGDKVYGNLKYAKIFLQKMKPFMKVKTVSRTDDDFLGKKFVFSGFRDKGLEDRIKEKGGSVVGSVSSKTSGVITNDVNESTGKLDKARSLGVKIYSKKDFEKIL